MRIAVNARFWKPEPMEGLGRHLVGILSEWVKARPNDQFLLIFDTLPQVKWQLGPNVSMKVVGPPARHPLLFILWYEISVPAAIKAFKADIFWSPDNFLSLRTSCPTLLTLHDVAYKHYPAYVRWDHRAYYRFFTPRFVKKAAHIITVSAFSKRDIIQQYGVAASKVTVAGNAAEAHLAPATTNAIALHKAQQTQGKPYFYYCGALHPRKNVSRLVAAYDLYRTNGGAPYMLVLTGRMAWQTNELVQQIADSAFKDDIICTGYLPDHEQEQWLQSAHALVYVSLFEGFGMPVLDALQCGVPVITSRNSAMSDITGETAALLVDPMNVDEIAMAMHKLSSDFKECNRLRVVGFEVSKAYSWAKLAKIYIDTAENLLRTNI